MKFWNEYYKLPEGIFATFARLKGTLVVSAIASGKEGEIT